MHQPIAEDEAHCHCFTPSAYRAGIVSDPSAPCPCPCHGPTWLTEGDADVPDDVRVDDG